MNAPRTLFLLPVAAIAAFLGYRLGHHVPPPSVEAKPAQRSGARPPVSEVTPRRGHALTSEELVDLLKKSLSGDLPVQARLAAMRSTDLRKLTEELFARSDTGPDTESLRPALVQAWRAWVEADPSAAFDFMVKRPPGYPPVDTGTALAEIARTDPALARKRLAEISDIKDAINARGAVFDAVANLSPDTWVEWMKTEPSQPGMVKRIPDAWVEDDPAAAAKRLESLPEMQMGSISMIAEAWAPRDLKAARAWAESLQDPVLREKAMHAVALATIADEPDGVGRST